MTFEDMDGTLKIVQLLAVRLKNNPWTYCYTSFCALF